MLNHINVQAKSILAEEQSIIRIEMLCNVKLRGHVPCMDQKTLEN